MKVSEAIRFHWSLSAGLEAKNSGVFAMNGIGPLGMFGDHKEGSIS